MAEGERTTTSFADLDTNAGTSSQGSGGGSSGVQGYPGYKDIRVQYDVTNITPDDLGRQLNDADDLYSQEDRKALRERLRNEGARQRESARTREQQTGNYAYQKWNLAKNNPRGNLNRLGYEDTLRYSRLADMVNNQFHYRPGHLLHLGTGKKGVQQQSDTATISRWDPIETEEMRQMQANRQLDARARNAQVDLQSRIQEYPQVIQEALDSSVREFTDFLSRQDVQFIQQALQTKLNEEYGGSWRAMWQNLNNKYSRELELMVGSRVWNGLKHLSANFMQAALAAFGRPATLPDSFIAAMEEYQDSMIQVLLDMGFSTAEAATMAKQFMSAFFNVIEGETEEAFVEGGKNPKNRDSSSSSSRVKAPTNEEAFFYGDKGR